MYGKQPKGNSECVTLMCRYLVISLIKHLHRGFIVDMSCIMKLIGGAVLHDGCIAEMKTGEGKTLVSTLAAYLNSLTGEGVHGMFCYLAFFYYSLELFPMGILMIIFYIHLAFYLYMIDAPTEIAFFTWCALHHKILVHMNLSKRGVAVVDGCFLCWAYNDMVRHLLLHCSFVCSVWCAVCSKLNVLQSCLLLWLYVLFSCDLAKT